MKNERKKVVVIGGGTGNFTVLMGLKTYPVDLTAIVTMADDGGSTGILRDELGVLPPGDVRQCLVALSTSSDLMRELMDYRFSSSGSLGGHSFGNLLLSALEKVTGKFELAVEEVGKILAIQGKVIPVTTHKVRLKMWLNSGKILEGEKNIYLSEEIKEGYSQILLEPCHTVFSDEPICPEANPHALSAIKEADLIVFGPGGLYTSLIPNLLVPGISEAIQKSSAKKIYVANLMNRKGQTEGFKVGDYLSEIAKFMGKDLFDIVLVNSESPPEELIEAYAEQGDLIENDLKEKRVRAACLLGKIASSSDGDLIKRSLIRHRPDLLAKEIMKIADNL